MATMTKGMSEAELAILCETERQALGRTIGRVAAFPAALAVVTIAMIVAILASGSQSMIGLSFAVVVAVLNGIIWFGWARAIGGTLG